MLGVMSKDRILAEIRRCAVENGGKPLGRNRFAAVTGIRESEWLGRYWTCWSDAVGEAGLQPNKFQGVVHSKDNLVRHLARLTRELGHFPTWAEIKFRSRQGDGFPSHNAFERLGDRSSRAKLVEEFARLDPDREAIRKACAAVAPKGPSDDEPTKASVPSGGFVYLQRSGKYHKIGQTNHVGRRDYELNLLLPEATELIHSFETDDPVGIERYWHMRFADKRVRGEWFLLTKADVAAFKRRRNFM